MRIQVANAELIEMTLFFDSHEDLNMRRGIYPFDKRNGSVVGRMDKYCKCFRAFVRKRAAVSVVNLEMIFE